MTDNERNNSWDAFWQDAGKGIGGVLVVAGIGTLLISWWAFLGLLALIVLFFILRG